MKDDWEEHVTDTIGFLWGCLQEMDTLSKRMKQICEDFDKKQHEISVATQMLHNNWVRRHAEEDDLK